MVSSRSGPGAFSASSQRRIVELLLCGCRDKQIARVWDSVSPPCALIPRTNLPKLGVQDRIELILRVFTTSRLLLLL